MKKILSLCGVALIALLASVGLAPAAHAYPDVSIDLTVNRQVLYGGESFTATGTSDVTCAWNLTWNGVEKSGTGTNGSPYVTSYTAPAVTKITKIPLNGTCTYTPPTSRTTAKASAASATWHRTIIITVLPRGSAVSPPTSGGGSDLPNTGGPNLLFLLAGLVLFGAGVSAVFVARRRAEDVDIVTGQA
jgi:LPXTG-motif cell wall-anchored protein